jgi:hypothetical protein
MARSSLNSLANGRIQVLERVSIPAMRAVDDPRNIGPAQAQIPEFPVAEAMQYLGLSSALTTCGPERSQAIESGLEAG